MKERGEKREDEPVKNQEFGESDFGYCISEKVSGM